MTFVSPDPTAPFSASRSPELLVEHFLREQSELTAVERFSQRHERDELPLRAKYYRDLIPLSGPGPGEQYAFRVDLDACSGCKACVVACHELNGLEDDETWREVGLLAGRDADLPVLQHVTAACHHCLDPGCVAGCPVRAYDKDAETGIVRHLDDQCIGCQYCIWTCPYEVPKFSAQKGIVRKCDMCQQRLAVHEAPACVQSCPNQAISIEITGRDEVRSRSQRDHLLATGAHQRTLPESWHADDLTESELKRNVKSVAESDVSTLAPDPRITAPTTRYVTRRTSLVLARSANNPIDQPQPAHWPLIIMLVLTQLAVGITVAERLLTNLFSMSDESHDWARLRFAMAVLAWGLTLLGLGVANFHLGRPWLAFRAMLGWRTSWLSREVLAFGAVQILEAVYVLMLWRAIEWGIPRWVVECFGTFVAAFAICAAATSAMVYVATKRDAWVGHKVFTQFGTSVLLFGLTVGLVVIHLARLLLPEMQTSPIVMLVGRLLLVAVIIVTGIRLARVRARFRTAGHSVGQEPTIEARVVRLLNGALHSQSRFRTTLEVLSGLIFPVLVASEAWRIVSPESRGYVPVQLSLLAMVLGLRLASETLERYLFFVTAVTSRLPGGMP